MLVRERATMRRWCVTTTMELFLKRLPQAITLEETDLPGVGRPKPTSFEVGPQRGAQQAHTIGQDLIGGSVKDRRAPLLVRFCRSKPAKVS